MPVVIDICKVTALIDLGAQVSNIRAQLCEDLDLEIQPLGQLLELEGTGVQLFLTSDLWRLSSKFQGLEATMSMCCCWPSPPQPMAEGVPVMVGSKIIDRALSCMTAGKLAHATAIWQQTHFGAVMSGSLQLSHSNSDKIRSGEKIGSSSQESGPCGGAEVPVRWCQRCCLHHKEGHYPTIPYG